MLPIKQFKSVGTLIDHDYVEVGPLRLAIFKPHIQYIVAMSFEKDFDHHLPYTERFSRQPNVYSIRNIFERFLIGLSYKIRLRQTGENFDLGKGTNEVYITAGELGLGMNSSNGLFWFAGPASHSQYTLRWYNGGGRIRDEYTVKPSELSGVSAEEKCKLLESRLFNFITDIVMAYERLQEHVEIVKKDPTGRVIKPTYAHILDY